MFFDFIRRRVKNAVLAGLEDALTEVDGTPDQPGAADRLRQLLLPAPEAEAPAAETKRGRQATV